MNESDVQHRFEILREDRSRFLAFAFARGDLLIEIDTRGVITYATGAGRQLSGLHSEDLVGLPLTEILSTSSKPAVDAVRLALKNRTLVRTQPVFVRSGSDLVPATIGGCPLPGQDDRYYLSIARSMPSDQAPVIDDRPEVSIEVKRDAETGLITAESFGEVTKRRFARAVEQDRALAMTVVDVEGLSELESRLPDSQANALMQKVGGLLSAFGGDRDAAARLAPSRFGVVHEAGVDTSSLANQISELARTVDPEGRGVEVATGELKLEANGMSEADAGRALVYAINKIAEDREGITVGSLNDALQEMLEDTVARVNAFRETLADKSCILVFQPIVDLVTRQVHHQEALSRLPDGSSPFKLVTFAEEAGFVTEFDLAVARKAIGLLNAHPTALPVAINVSGRSLESTLFAEALDDLLSPYPQLRRRLMIEITESSRITHLDTVQNVVLRLRAAGHHVCIDDFGAGAAAFHYLRALSVDVVKIDGAYVKDVESSARDRAFVRAIVSLCRELGIDTVAEFVENREQVKILVELGVKYGQGYLFARPRSGLYERAAPQKEHERVQRQKVVRPARWI